MEISPITILTTVRTGQQTSHYSTNSTTNQLTNAQSHQHPNSLHIQTDYSPNSLHLPSRLRSKSHQNKLTHVTSHYSQSHHSSISLQFKLTTLITVHLILLLQSNLTNLLSKKYSFWNSFQISLEYY